MNEDKKIEKHIGEQKPINQNSKPVDNNGGNQDNSNSESGNPIKPQETQKGLKPKEQATARPQSGRKWKRGRAKIPSSPNLPLFWPPEQNFF